jgi:hypothetical protein
MAASITTRHPILVAKPSWRGDIDEWRDKTRCADHDDSGQ